MLDDQDTEYSDTLLATIVILRFLEEIDPGSSGFDAFYDKGHRIGARIFMQAQILDTSHSSLACAAFWLGVRQEIHYAVRNRQAAAIDLTNCCLGSCALVAHEGTWANAMAAHCIEVIDHCLGDGSIVNQASFARLWQHGENQLQTLPASYQPLYSDHGNKCGRFPEIIYLSDMAATGMLMYYLARILLTAFDPSIPRLGPFSRQALRKLDEDLKHDLRMMCGIALTNGMFSLSTFLDNQYAADCL